MGMRLDRHVPQGTEMFSLSAPIEWSERASLEIAYVCDDTRNISLNLREGTRAKVWSEYYVDRDGTSFGTFGFDARKYLRSVFKCHFWLGLALFNGKFSFIF